MIDYAIQTDGLSRSFGAVQAVEDVSLRIPAGTIFGFLGPNGSGKTTTIRLLLGLLEPSRGSATVLGFDSRSQSSDIRQRTGALLEHPGLYERLSAQENLEFYARVWELSPGERDSRVKELLTHMGLWERRTDQVGNWSRGMKQKLAVARAMLHRPSLIFLDEPTAGLDPVASAALRDDLSSLVAREGVTVFLTTHNLPEAESICNLVGVIRQGHLLTVDSPQHLRSHGGEQKVEISGNGFSPAILEELRLRPEVAEVKANNGTLTLALRDERPVAPLVRLLVEEGCDIEEVRKGAASLEQAFLALMERES
ncbi:MAG TPA: ABC transporter ATP-binding protein [Nitrolancea sp.]|nr:ABC transporter ATP-binding protein [Nitrolancea sp.]